MWGVQGLDQAAIIVLVASGWSLVLKCLSFPMYPTTRQTRRGPEAICPWPSEVSTEGS